VTPEEFIKITSTYGFPAGLAALMVWNVIVNKKEPSGGGQVMSKLDAIDGKVQLLSERVSRIEGKLDA
jgi:hypothetical protein